MPVKLTKFDAADFLRDEVDMAGYLEAAAEENDPATVMMALSAVARARNKSQLARDTGMTRAGLSRALSANGNPSLATVMKVADALGFQVTLKPKAA